MVTNNFFKLTTFTILHFIVCQPSLQPADVKLRGLQKCFIPGEKFLETSCTYTTGGSVVSIAILGLAYF